MNGPPKQAEKVASGSVTPTSVPASLEVKPTKWYAASSELRIDTGGKTQKASAVSKTYCFWVRPSCSLCDARVTSWGYAKRVFSVLDPSKDQTLGGLYLQ